MTTASSAEAEEEENRSIVGAQVNSTGRAPWIPPYRDQLERIVAELRFITKKIRDKEHDDLITMEWKFAARVIDRFCLIVFGVFNVIAAAVILTSAPNLVASFTP